MNVGDRVRVIDEKAARVTGKRVGTVGKVWKVTRMTWVEFEDGAMIPFHASELEAESARYAHLRGAA